MPRSKGKLNLDQIAQAEQSSLEDVKSQVMGNMQSRANQPAGSAPMKGGLGLQLAQSAQDTAPPQGSQLPEYDEESFIKQYLDPATLESRPEYANGMSPDTAINQSPLSVLDRAKMSIGTDTGGLKFLQEKFGKENVAVSKGKFVTVKDANGSWYQIDPNGGGSGDPWERSKEIAKDILGDNAGLIGSAALTIGALATAPMTGGASLIAAASVGAGTSLLRTSLGRMAGTYDSTPEEQLKDIAIETALSIGGQGIALGLKPTAQVIGSAFGRAAEQFKKLPLPSRDLIAKVQGYTTGVGEDTYRTWMNQADEVGTALKNAGKGALDSDSVVTNLTQQNIQATKNLAQETRTGLTKFYQSGLDDIAAKAGDKFQPKIASSVSETFKEYADQGFGELAKDGKFLLKNQKDIAKMMAQSGQVSPLADEAGYGLLNKYVNYVNDVVAGQKDLTGKAAVNQYVALEQRLGQKARELALEAADVGGVDVINVIKGINQKILNKSDEFASKSIGTTELSESFKNLQKTYGSYKNQLSPILDAQTAYIKKGSNEVFNGLYDRMFKNTSLTTRGTGAKNALQTAISDIGKYSPNITKLTNEININKAAAAAMPAIRPGLVGQAATYGAVMSLNPSVIGAAAGTSPRLNYELAKTVGAQFKGMDFLKSLAPAKRIELMSNPKMAAQFFQTIVKTPQVEDEVKSQLMGAVKPPGGQ